MSATTMNTVAKIQDENRNGSSTSAIEQPREIIRPVVGEGTVQDVLQRMYGMVVLRIRELNSYDDRNYFLTVDETHYNKAVTQLHPHGYLLKISNTIDSLNHHYFDAQHILIPYLNKSGIRTQTLVPNLNGDAYSLEEIYADKDKHGAPCKCMVELRNFIPGTIIRDVPYTPDLLIQDGQLVAKIALALKGFDHSFYASRDFSWSVTKVPKFANYICYLENNDDRRLVEEIIAAFNKEVVSSYDMIPTGYIHGDLNEQNILVSQDATSGLYNVSGIIDYTDVTNSYPIMDLAINIAHFMTDSAVVAQLDAPGYILAGYLGVRDLTDAEWRVLPYCVAGRLIQLLIHGARDSYLDPENDYLLSVTSKSLPILREFWLHPREELVYRWKDIVSSISG